MALTPAEIAAMVALAEQRAGLALNGDVGFRLETRLGPVARASGFNTVSDLVANLRVRRDEALARAVTEALADTESWFFRDPAAWRTLRERILPELAGARGGRALRVLSVGCSTGQEPYGLAMTWDGLAPAHPGVLLHLEAADLSTRALEKAQAGLYTQFEVQRGLPIRTLLKHFGKEDDHWRLEPAMRQAVRFRPVNLLALEPTAEPWDLILCRHVLSGMTEAGARRALAALTAGLAPDGVLMLGEGEAAGDLGPLAPMREAPGFYARPRSRRAAA